MSKGLKLVVDVKEWAEKYDISLKPSACVKCKKLFEFTIPVALKKYRGVTQEPHECGPEYTQLRVVPIDLFNSLKDRL